MEKHHLLELIDKYLTGKASAEEIDLLSRYYNSFQQDHVWNQEELGAVADTEAKIFAGIAGNIELAKEDLATNPAAMDADSEFARVPKSRGNLIAFTRIAVAACFTGLLIGAGILLFRGTSRKEFTQRKPAVPANANETISGGAKAMLTLADGSVITLDNTGNGEIAVQGSTRVTKTDKKLFYVPLTGVGETAYNTLTTSRGGAFEVALPDGSRVWLNATSSLRFPVAFTKKQRRVEITGEAYFEVARNKALPFIVEVNGAEVQVLGTHFNIMAYHDETSLKTTLLEGAVKFVKGVQASSLKPGQQSQLLRNGQIVVTTPVDLSSEIAWKNDWFDFQGADIKTVTRQLARWYAVDFMYSEDIEDHFIAKMPRTTSLEKMLGLLELTGKVHFEIQGNRVIVKR